MKQVIKHRGISIWNTDKGYVVCHNNERPKKKYNNTYHQTLESAENSYNFLHKIEDCGHDFDAHMRVLFGEEA